MPKEVECPSCGKVIPINDETTKPIETVTGIKRILTCPHCNETYWEQGLLMWTSTRSARSIRILEE